MNNLTKQEALILADEWWISDSLTKKENLKLIEKYGVETYTANIFISSEDTLKIFLSEHPDIQIVEPLSLFEKAENLWQNLNAAIILLEVGGKPNMKILKECIELNKPSKQDEGVKHP